MNSELCRELAGLGLSIEQMVGVLAVIEKRDALHASKEDERKAQIRARVQKFRSKNKPETLRNVTETDGNGVKPLTRAEGSSSKGEIKESKVGKEDTSPSARSMRGTRIPDNFKPDVEAAIADGLTRSAAELQAKNFTDYWLSKPGKDGLKLDWPATWRLWYRRDLNSPQRSTPSARQTGVSAAAQRIMESEANGTEGLFGNNGNAQLVSPAGGSGPRNAAPDLHGGIGRQFRTINH